MFGNVIIKGQCSTQVHDVIGELCEEVQEMKVNWLLKNASMKSMSSSDDDNGFPACSTCWNKGQCEMFKNNGWPRVSRTVFNIVKSKKSFTDLPQQIE